MRNLRSIRIVFALAVTAGLGFGGTQALASPGTFSNDEPRICQPTRCSNDCYPCFGSCDEITGWCECDCIE